MTRIQIHHDTSTDFELHHFALAVPDLDRAAKALLILGYQSTEGFAECTLDPNQRVKLKFLTHRTGRVMLELVAPLSNSSPISSLLKTQGSSLYHSCYLVKNIEVAGKRLRESGFRPVTPVLEAIAFSLRKIQFFHAPDIGLIEILSMN